jgi:hypothetical protein
MKKLNGWKRIGIIASVLWILIAGIHTYDSEMDSAEKSIASIHIACDGYLAGKTGDAWTIGFNECNREANDNLDIAIKGAWLDATLIALVPMPLGWAFIYLLLFLMRWVKRGFIGPV